MREVRARVRSVNASRYPGYITLFGSLACASSAYPSSCPYTSAALAFNPLAHAAADLSSTLSASATLAAAVMGKVGGWESYEEGVYREGVSERREGEASSICPTHCNATCIRCVLTFSYYPSLTQFPVTSPGNAVQAASHRRRSSNQTCPAFDETGRCGIRYGVGGYTTCGCHYAGDVRAREPFSGLRDNRIHIHAVSGNAGRERGFLAVQVCSTNRRWSYVRTWKVGSQVVHCTDGMLYRAHTGVQPATSPPRAMVLFLPLIPLQQRKSSLTIHQERETENVWGGCHRLTEAYGDPTFSHTCCLCCSSLIPGRALLEP